MSKHKAKNTIHWTTWEVNTVCQWNLASLYQIIKEKFSSKNSSRIGGLKTSSRPFGIYKELSTASIGKWNFLSKLLILDM